MTIAIPVFIALIFLVWLLSQISIDNKWTERVVLTLAFIAWACAVVMFIIYLIK